jgi:hypothetical protein
MAAIRLDRAKQRRRPSPRGGKALSVRLGYIVKIERFLVAPTLPNYIRTAREADLYEPRYHSKAPFMSSAYMLYRGCSTG